GTDVHVHSVPVLLGAKYYLMPDHQGIFGAAEIGMFDLMSSVSSGGTSGSSTDVKFGGGIGLGWQMKQWNARVKVTSPSFGLSGGTVTGRRDLSHVRFEGRPGAPVRSVGLWDEVRQIERGAVVRHRFRPVCRRTDKAAGTHSSMLVPKLRLRNLFRKRIVRS